MRSAVTAALDGRREVDPRDAAAERLALNYAGLIDRAAPGAKYRKALAVISRAVAGMGDEDDDPQEAFDIIATALADHTVASDLGPKLLEALKTLGLTTASRGDQKGVKPNVAADPLDELKRKRAERLGTAVPR